MHIVNNIEKNIPINKDFQTQIKKILTEIQSTKTSLQEHFYQPQTTKLQIDELKDLILNLNSEDKNNLIEIFTNYILQLLEDINKKEQEPEPEKSSNTLMIVGGIVFVLLIVAFVKRKELIKMFKN